MIVRETLLWTENGGQIESDGLPEIDVGRKSIEVRESKRIEENRDHN